MLHFLYGSQLTRHSDLARSMFRDRARQFHDRLKWKVQVNAAGEERDIYDALDPLYVIWEGADGRHGGSMRFLPTTGATMVNDHFSGLLPDGLIRDAGIWECTRFCLSSQADGRTAAALMLGGAEVMRGFGVRQFVGVFDARMVRIYRRTGASPQVLGTSGAGRNAIHLGLWRYDPADHAQLLVSSDVSAERARQWFTLARHKMPYAHRLCAA